MQIRQGARFEKQYRKLPAPIKHQAEKALRHFMETPYHPALNFEKLHGREEMYSIRVNRGYRIILEKDGDIFTLLRIGTHDIYDF